MGRCKFIPEGENLTFEDGILLCKHIYQCAIHKTLQGVIEEWQIYEKTHGLLKEVEDQKTALKARSISQFDKRRLDEILFHLDMDNVYATM